MENKKIIKRGYLIEQISEIIIQIRKESKLTQEDMASILGISKNTIVNVEKNKNKLSWSVVMSIVMLFNQTNSIKSIIGDESPLEVISRCAFLEDDSNKNNMLYTTSITGLVARSMIPVAGGIIASGLYELFNKNNDKK